MKKTYNIFSKMGRKNLSYCVVALILVLVTTVGVSYSWIENLTAVQITNTNSSGTAGSQTATLSLADDLDSTIEIRNCGEGSVATESKFNAIDLGTYFNESGDMHLTTCSGDGESFYFKNLEDNTTYRLGTEDEENVSYLSATFKVSSPEASVDFWFKEAPTVKINNTAIDVAYYSITVDGETNVYSTAGGTYSCIEKTDGTATTVTARKIGNYLAGGEELFTVEQGDTKEVSVKLWLQYTDNSTTYSDQTADISMIITSSWGVDRTITIFDGTTNGGTSHWIYNDSATMWVALATDPDTYHWSIDINTSTHIGTVTIPGYYVNEDIIIYRCSSSGWDKNTDGTIKHKDIWCWNYWDATIPSNFGDLTLSIVGNTPYDATNKQQSDTGYSFWGEAEKITVHNYAGLDAGGSDAQDITLLVHDCDTGDYYALYGDGNTWVGYVPVSSDRLAFLYKNKFEKNYWNSASVAEDNTSSSCYKNETPTYSWGYGISTDYDSSKSTTDMYYYRPGSGQTYYKDYYIYGTTSGTGGAWDDPGTTSAYYLRGEVTSGTSISGLDWTTGINMYSIGSDDSTVYTTMYVDGTIKFKIYSSTSSNWYTCSTSSSDSYINIGSSYANDFSNTDSGYGNALMSVGSYGNEAGTYLFAFDKDEHTLTVTSLS